MDALRQYIFSIISAALICGILSRLTQNGAAKEFIRLICGIFLAVIVFRPLSQIDFDVLISDFYTSQTQTAEELAVSGEKMAEQAMAESIKARYESYILDKAAELNTELTVAVTVNEEYVPVYAELNGEITPYARRQLEYILESDLGITKENQLWTG